jgi:TPR repeat protein
MTEQKLDADQVEAVWELSAILMDHVTSANQARRVAELLEFLDPSHRLSMGWWRRAADAGDEDAAGYLGILIDEGVAERRPHDTE